MVGLVEILRVDPVELSHALGEIRIRRFHEQMIMIAHQAVRMDRPVETINHAA